MRIEDCTHEKVVAKGYDSQVHIRTDFVVNFSLGGQSQAFLEGFYEYDKMIAEGRYKEFEKLARETNATLKDLGEEIFQD